MFLWLAPLLWLGAYVFCVCSYRLLLSLGFLPLFFPSHTVRLTHTQPHSHSDSLILRLTHIQTHTQTHSYSDSFMIRLIMLGLAQTQTHSHSYSLTLRPTQSDTLTFRLAQIQTYSGSDPFNVRLIHTQPHSHLDSLALRLATYSHSDLQTGGCLE